MSRPAAQIRTTFRAFGPRERAVRSWTHRLPEDVRRTNEAQPGKLLVTQVPGRPELSLGAEIHSALAAANPVASKVGNNSQVLFWEEKQMR